MTLARTSEGQTGLGSLGTVSNFSLTTTARTPRDYLTKYDENPAGDLLWNIPEIKHGSINVIGGHVGSFRTVIRTAEFLEKQYPLEAVKVILPDSLREKVPDLPNFQFLKATGSGSFEDAAELSNAYASANFNLLMGDFSKNEITRQALEKSLKPSTPLLLTRDTIDLLATETATAWLGHDNLILFATLPQLQKLLRAIYYPKMLLLSQSLVQVAEVLHKFTLSFSVQIVTLANGEILIAKSGQVAAVSLEQTGYTPFSVWNGELAAKIAAINLYNPHNFINATLAAVF